MTRAVVLVAAATAGGMVAGMACMAVPAAKAPAAGGVAIACSTMANCASSCSP